MKKIMYIALIAGLSSASAVYAGSVKTSNQYQNIISSQVITHSGGTNADGCHNDHKKGTYHCH